MSSEKNCIKCGKPIASPLAKYRKGTSAKKCDRCLMEDMIAKAEALSTRANTTHYTDSRGNKRVQIQFSIPAGGAIEPDRIIGRYIGKEPKDEEEKKAE